MDRLRLGAIGCALLLEADMGLWLKLFWGHILKDWLCFDHLELGFEGLKSTGCSGRITAAASVVHVDWQVFHFGTRMTPVTLASTIFLGLFGVDIDETRLAEELWDLFVMVYFSRVVAVIELVSAGHCDCDGEDSDDVGVRSTTAKRSKSTPSVKTDNSTSDTSSSAILAMTTNELKAQLKENNVAFKTAWPKLLLQAKYLQENNQEKKAHQLIISESKERIQELCQVMNLTVTGTKGELTEKILNKL